MTTHDQSYVGALVACRRAICCAVLTLQLHKSEFLKAPSQNPLTAKEPPENENTHMMKMGREKERKKKKKKEEEEEEESDIQLNKLT